MRSRGVAHAFVLMLLAAGLTGCFGAKDEPLATSDDMAPVNNSSTELPDGRGVSAGTVETNKTEEGVGGVDHKHDYWQGAESVELYQRNLGLSIFPIYPNGEGSTPTSVGYIKLPDGKLVYEGAEKVTIIILAPTRNGQENVAAGPLTVQWRTAAASQWTDARVVQAGEIVEIPVSSRETDMPHSTSSLWMFRITAERAYFQSVNVTVMAYRGSEVVDWPGHPDFYGERKDRVIFDGDVKTHIAAFPENTFYEGNTWAVPNKLISHGTGRVEVWANVTKFTSRTGAPATAYYLNMHNATQGGFETDIFNWYDDSRGENNLESYHFVIPVTIDGMDGPYQPESRWGFHLEAGVGGVSPVGGIPFLSGGCGDCDSYDIEYHLTIVAYAADEIEPLG